MFVLSCSKAALKGESPEPSKSKGSVVAPAKTTSPQGEQSGQRVSITSYLENTQQMTDSLVSQIRSGLPKKESSAVGFVVSLRDQAVYVDLTAKDGVQVGSQLRVYREGEALTHPVTGQVLGTPSENIGTLQVTQVEPNYSVATILSMEKGRMIAPKDRVELLAGKSTLALLPFSSNSVVLSSLDLTPLQTEVAEKLQATGAVEVVKGTEVNEILKERGLDTHRVLDQRSIKELAGQLKSNYLLDGLIQQEGDRWVLISRLLSSADGTTVSEVSVPLVFNEQFAAGARPSLERRGIEEPVAALPRPPLTAPPSTPSQAPKIPEPGPEASGPSDQSSHKGGELLEVGRSEPLPFGIHGLDVGDLYGDGRKELVLLGRNSVQVYAWPTSFKESQVHLEELYIYRGPRAVVYLSVGVGDINKNGRDEVFVTSLEAGRLSSFVLEYSQGEFKPVVQDQNLFFRVVKSQNQPPQLLAQHFGATQAFFGDLLVYDWRDGRYQEVGKLSLPTRTDIYGFALFNPGHGKDPEVLLLDDEDHLKFLRGGRLVWKSKEFYGGSKLTFSKIPDQETADTILQANPVHEEFQDIWRIPIKEKILIEDLDRDGLPEVILRKNIAPVRIVKGVTSYQRGQMAVLKWNGLSFQERYTAPVLENYIVDYQLVLAATTGSSLLVVGLNQDEGFFLPSQQSQVVFFAVNVY